MNDSKISDTLAGNTKQDSPKLSLQSKSEHELELAFDKGNDTALA